MTYSYQAQPIYGPQVQQVKYNEPTLGGKSSVPAILTGASVGAVTGAVIGASKKPKIFNNNLLSDEFVKNVHNKFLKTNEVAKNFNDETNYSKWGYI